MLPRLLVFGVLVLSPIVIVAGVVLMLSVIAGFRRGFGAISELPPAALAAAVVVLAVHGGFFAAPFLFAAGRRGLAVGVTAPVAVVGTLAIIAGGVWLLRESSEAPGWLVPALVGMVAAAYIAPVCALVLS